MALAWISSSLHHSWRVVERPKKQNTKQARGQDTLLWKKTNSLLLQSRSQAVFQKEQITNHQQPQLLAGGQDAHLQLKPPRERPAFHQRPAQRAWLLFNILSLFLFFHSVLRHTVSESVHTQGLPQRKPQQNNADTVPEEERGGQSNPAGAQQLDTDGFAP